MNDIIERLGLQEYNSGAWTDTPFDTSSGEVYTCHNPTDGSVLGHVRLANKDHLESVISTAQEKFTEWRMLPAPKRGEIVRLMGDALRKHKDDLGALVSLEVGKIRSEGLGEVQESIDMADFCVGLSRQLYGLSMHSERNMHRMYEQWPPL